MSKKPMKPVQDLKRKKRTAKEQLAFQEGATWALLTLGVVAVAVATHKLTHEPETEENFPTVSGC